MALSNPVKYQYLHINSEHREHRGQFSHGIQQQPTTDDAIMRVNLSGHQFKDVKSVAVKQFTIDNSLFNITRRKGKLSFAEIKLNETPNGTDTFKVFTIDLFALYGGGYYSSKDLLVGSDTSPSMINFQLSVMPRSINTETKSQLRFVQDQDTFTLALEYQNDGNFSKFFVPILNNDVDDLWLDFGFTKDQVLESKYLSMTNADATALVNARYVNNGITPRGSTTVQPMVLYPPLYPLWKNFSNGNWKSTAFVGRHPVNIENTQGIYLTSTALTSGNTFETSNRNGHLQATPQNILEFIQFDGEHYQTISYKPDILHYHYLGGKTINEIDIGIVNHSGTLYQWNEIGRFHLVLVFEVELHQEVSAQFIKQYNEEGYNRAHTKDNLILRKF